MVEMNETSLILNNATECSLVILDHIDARYLFATHYHEITALAQSRSAVKN